MTFPIEPASVASHVDDYVTRELADAAKYDNRTPLDESGVYSLHLLAADVYALAWHDATCAAAERERGARQRDRARQEAAE